MNEIALSKDINVITAEINSYKNMAGQAIFEIGRRLKHVRDDMKYGKWDEWCESIDITRQQANKYIKVFDEFSNGNLGFQLGINALYLIATLPEEEREKTHTIPSTGEQKTVDEMTVRELEEVKKALKEAKQQAEQAKRSEEIAVGQLEKAEADKEKLAMLLTEERNKQPEVIEKEIVKEIIPDNVKSELEFKQRQLDIVKKEIERLKSENESYKLNDSSDFDEELAEKERKKLEWEAERNVLRFKIKVDKFLEEVAITAFMEGAIAASGKSTKDKLRESVELMKNFTNKMEVALNGRVEL